MWILLSLLIVASNARADFSELWHQMQENYQKILGSIDQESFNSQYCTAHWADCRKPLQDFLLGTPQEKFIDFNVPGLCWAYWNGFDHLNEWQLIYLQDCTREKTKFLLKRISEHPIANLPCLVKEFECSTLSLMHLFYLCRILETAPENDIHSLVEVGGGYGNLMRLAKQMIPDLTGIMFDIPEMAAIQWLYLKTTLPETNVIFHTSKPDTFEEGAIHVLPASLIDAVKVKTDVFVSTFALSESSDFFQKKVIQKDFFDAGICYVTGQLHGWNNYFVNHINLHESIRNLYRCVLCVPSTNSTQEAKSYELIAFKDLEPSILPRNLKKQKTVLAFTSIKAASENEIVELTH